MKEPDDIEEDFASIDMDRLDYELLRQPRLVWAMTKAEAKARLRLDNAKAALDLIAAELQLAIRSDPKEYIGLEKVTEAIISAAVESQPTYQHAVKAVNQAKYELGVYTAAVNGLEHKKKSLESLTTLHSQNYFSEPKVPKVSEPEVREAQKRMTRKGVRRDDSE